MTQRLMEMRGRSKKIIVVIFLVIVLGLAAILFDLWGNLLTSKTGAISSRYLFSQGFASKIYVLSATSSYTVANTTYVSGDGQQIPKGSRLFVISLTLRNDYTREDPPPPAGNVPVFPVDGTAYINLNVTLNSKEGAINAVNLTPSDFSTPSPDKTGLVLASGQTSTINLYYATERADINQFEINLVSVHDSIPY